MLLSREDIIRHLGEITAEYELNPHMSAFALGRFIGLYDAIKRNGDGSEEMLDNEIRQVLDTMPVTLYDVDCMAIETLVLTGEITIREDTPPDKSVGWVGSDAIEGKIKGRFEVPASVLTSGPPYTQPHITVEECTYSIHYYLTETPDLWAKIEDWCMHHVIPEVEFFAYKPDVVFTGITPKGDRTVVEFEVVLKEA